MAKTVKKGFLVYLLWFAFIVFGLFCIFASIMLFNPGKDVFGIGIKYFSSRSAESINTMEISNNPVTFSSLNITKVKFNSNYANFNVAKNDSYTALTFGVNRKVNGFSKTQESLDCKPVFSYSGTTLTIDVVAPDFWLPLTKYINIIMYFPGDYNASNIAFEINTNSGNIDVASEESNKTLSIKDLNIKTETGTVKLFDKLSVVSGNANIDATKSEVYISSNLNGNISYKTDNGKLVVDKIDGSLSVDAARLNAKCSQIGGDVNYSSKSGVIRIDKLGTNSTNGNFIAIENTLHIADVIIEEMTGDLVIYDAQNSNISVSKLHGSATISTSSGSVEILDAKKNVEISTTSGKVNVTQTGENARTIIETQTGQITANFTSVKDVELNSEKANININVKAGIKFIFYYDSGKGTNISWKTTDVEDSGRELVGILEETETDNTFVATTQGKINLKNGFEVE